VSPGLLGIAVFLTIFVVAAGAGQSDVGSAGHLQVVVIVNALFWASMLLMAWGAVRVLQGAAA
jgi:hypothetical protein